MALPALGPSGDLPVGVHQATLAEVLDQFGKAPGTRITTGRRLERIYRLADGTGKLARFIIFGSFITDKPDPNDVDVFLVMQDAFDASSVSGEAALLFDHAAAASHFGASVFWLCRRCAWGGEESTIEYWQVTRGGGQRGIVEVVKELA